MPDDLAYDVAVLRESAGRHTAVGDAAATLAVGVARLPIDGAALGDVPSAGEFVRVASSVREAQANGAAGEASRRKEVAGRMRAVAALGERLTADTTQAARGEVPFGDGTGILSPPAG